MAKYIGIWMDHQHAVVVALNNGVEKVSTLKAEVESRTQMLGGSKTRTPYAPHDAAPEKQRDRRVAREVQQFYGQVAEHLENPDHLFIFGPGKAGTEMAAELQKSPMLKNVPVDIESADKLTRNQIVTEVKKHYDLLPPRKKLKHPGEIY